MSMDPMAMPTGAPDEGEAPGGGEAETNYARACAALELASGSPEALTTPATEFRVSLQTADGSAVVTIGDVEVAVTAEQIDAEVGAEMEDVEMDLPMGMDE